MKATNIAKIITNELIKRNFIVHRYNSKSTSSIYLKLDYGVACAIRIADHPGKKKYSYRFNIIKNYSGNKTIIKDGLICYFYDFSELNSVIKAVQKEKDTKIKKYGIDNYKKFMIRNSQNELYIRFKKVKGE